ncbi:hypothetical protein U1Q18_024144 [Sarracenia purpurea var. burkii]
MAFEEAGRREIEKNLERKKQKVEIEHSGTEEEEEATERLQERWKKMTETENNNHYFFPASFPDQMPPRVQAPFAKLGGFGVWNNGAAAGVLLGLNQSLSLQTLGNGLVPDQFQRDPYGVGVLKLGLRPGNVGGETLKELSSIPNTNCYPCHCGLCHKKKSINGENFRCSFPGFDLPNKQNINGEDHDFGMGLRAPRHAGNAGCNVDQGVKITAVHRKGSSSMGGTSGGVLMEYDFFPGKGGGRDTSSSSSSSSTFFSSSSSSKELDFLGFTETSVPVCGGEGSCVTTTTTTSTGIFDASISIDLSLKLSY